jgi:inorganic pyrophosphatase
MDYSKCSFESTDSRVVVKENRSRFQVENPDRLLVTKVQVDGCLIADDLEKCDWIIAINAVNKRALYIELKGCNIDKALKQLKSTLVHTKNNYKDYKKECYVVTTRIPKFGPSMAKKSIEFQKSTGCKLLVKNINSSVPA